MSGGEQGVTFDALGIPFPLFKGPVREATEYAGAAVCSLCKKQVAHCFQMGIGCDLIGTCERCGEQKALDADDRNGRPCDACKGKVIFPVAQRGDIFVCYGCLRAGKAAITKDTAEGMISWEGVRKEQAKLPVDTWSGVKRAEPAVLELLRTPTYVTLQGEKWEFCCGAPMMYLGMWGQKEFNAHAKNGDGQALFEEIVEEPEEGLWEGELHDETGIYVFRCGACGKMRANWDIA